MNWLRFFEEHHLQYKHQKLEDAELIDFPAEELELHLDKIRHRANDPALEFVGMFDTSDTFTWLLASPTALILVEDMWDFYLFADPEQHIDRIIDFFGNSSSVSFRQSFLMSWALV